MFDWALSTPLVVTQKNRDASFPLWFVTKKTKKIYNQLHDPDKQDGEEINISNIRRPMFLKTFEKNAGCWLHWFAPQ